MAQLIIIATLSVFISQSRAVEVNPVGKVLQLLSDLESKIVAEGNAAQKRYAEFTEFCEERSANLDYQIKTANGEQADLEATIGAETQRVASLKEQIAGFLSDLAKADADMKAAQGVRDKEAADFDSEEKELLETVDTLERAIGILEKHASLAQIKNAGSISQALAMLVQSSEISVSDNKRLTALVQSTQEAEESDPGAPAGEVYEGHSGDIVQTLQDLADKANDQIAALRKAEVNNRHKFELVKQALGDQITFGNKDVAKAKKNAAESGQAKAGAEADLAQTKKLLSSDTAALDDLRNDCTSTATNYEAESKSRAEELKALRDANKVISETTKEAEGRQYDLAQMSFLQHSSSTSHLNEAVHFVREFAQKQHSPAFAQLAARMGSALRAGVRAGEDPFGKVKDLISSMIEKLEADADADASHKAYCDKEISETKVKQADKNAEINKLSTKIDGLAARTAQLKEEVAALETALAELAAAQVEMDKLRAEEKAAFAQGKPEMEQGIAGVRSALQILRDYYGNQDKAHSAAEGAGQGIIGLLEVVESDFSQSLSEMIAAEDAAAAAYVKETKENEIERTTKQQDLTYKKKESTNLDQAIVDTSSDREGVQTELDAVMEYFAGLEKQCVAKAETFAERKRRFEAELAGLKQALQILEGQSLLQTNAVSKRFLRSVKPHSI